MLSFHLVYLMYFEIFLSNNDKFLLQIDSERAIVITTGWEKAQEMKCRIISEVQAYG